MKIPKKKTFSNWQKDIFFKKPSLGEGISTNADNGKRKNQRKDTNGDKVLQIGKDERMGKMKKIKYVMEERI